jgi:CBS domain-containing protein
MKVSDIMTRDVHLLSPEQTIREAAGIMATSTPARCRSATTIG